MNTKTYFTATAALFAIIALLHLYRILRGFEAHVGNWMVPMWLSVVAVALAGYLALAGWKLSK